MARRHGQSITVWLTPADVKAFDRRARESAQSRTEALRGLVRGFIAGTNVAPQLYAELGLLREELRRIGVNLNQAQRLANAYRRPTRAVSGPHAGDGARSGQAHRRGALHRGDGMSLLELDRGRVAPGSAGARRRCGRQAIEAALSGLGYQAAIIKVPRHSKTLKATKTTIEYLRHGCEEVENELGERRTIDEAKADVDKWKKPRHRGARTSTHVIISLDRKSVV